MIVRPQLRGVAPHLVRGPTVRSCGVPDPGGHVNVLVIERDPGFGKLTGFAILDGKALDELADRLNVPIKRLVEESIDLERLGHADGSQRSPVLARLVNKVVANRSGRIVDLEPPGTRLLGRQTQCPHAQERNPLRRHTGDYHQGHRHRQ
ncbi:MAG TPA: hypothetical protein EYQ64_01105 [Gemmatimonadetes bacterium]|nr:hypothetical protein [Gemmatimonadota bacterium]